MKLKANSTPPQARAWNPIRLWKRQRLSRKLTLGVWLTMLPFTAAGSSLALWNAHQMVMRQWETRSLKDVELINTVVQTWDDAILTFLMAQARDSELIGLQPDALAKELRKSQYRWGDYAFAVFNPKGEILAKTNTKTKQPAGLTMDAQSIRQQDWFQGAMAGTTMSSMTIFETDNKAYTISATPIRSNPADQRSKPIAVLASQIKLSSFDQHSGLGSVFSATENAQNGLKSLINLDRGQHRGIAALIILNPGGVHFIGHQDMDDRYRKTMLDPAKAKHSRWWPVIQASLRPGPETESRVLTIDGTRFLLAIKRDSEYRSVALIIDQGTLFRNVDTLFAWFWLVNLVALSLSSLAIDRICRALSKPVDQAGEALAAISQGNFDTKLPTDSSDMGRLFADINKASEQLKSYLEESTQHAVTDAQLSEARQIQDNFLIKDLPKLQELSLTASFDPAYEIGADWYDTLTLGDTLFVVVADVCDKGIPSALYMSVFRSLLRHNIIAEHQYRNDPSEVIQAALTGVNEYMASTHGMTAMFATVFIGAYAINHQRLSYIVAGHEAPMVLRNHQLEALNLGGPAVGLFNDCVFTPQHCQLEPGSLLLAYSDGLPDTTNGQGLSFGTERIRSILSEQSSAQWTAEALLERLQQAAREHQGDADQFDDLTLMVMKIEQLAVANPRSPLTPG